MTSPLTPIALKGYAIYNPLTGKYSRGGSGPKWGKHPKIWADLGHVKSHLRLAGYFRQSFYNHSSSISKAIFDKNNWRYEFVYNKAYLDCVLLDVTTMQPSTELNMNQFIDDCVNEEIAEYGADRCIKVY